MSMLEASHCRPSPHKAGLSPSEGQLTGLRWSNSNLQTVGPHPCQWPCQLQVLLSSGARPAAGLQNVVTLPQLPCKLPGHSCASHPVQMHLGLEPSVGLRSFNLLILCGMSDREPCRQSRQSSGSLRLHAACHIIVCSSTWQTGK